MRGLCWAVLRFEMDVKRDGMRNAIVKLALCVSYTNFIYSMC